MRRVVLSAAIVLVAGCGYKLPPEVAAVRGDWVSDSGAPGNFRVLIIDPSLEREFYWFETHVYSGGRLVDGSSGNFKWEPGKLSLKQPIGFDEYEIAEANADSLVLKKSGQSIRYRKMTEADYDRVDWSVSKIDRLKGRGGPRNTR